MGDLMVNFLGFPVSGLCPYRFRKALELVQGLKVYEIYRLTLEGELEGGGKGLILEIPPVKGRYHFGTILVLKIDLEKG